jgi:hypothetical protein
VLLFTQPQRASCCSLQPASCCSLLNLNVHRAAFYNLHRAALYSTSTCIMLLFTTCIVLLFTQPQRASCFSLLYLLLLSSFTLVSRNQLSEAVFSEALPCW